MKALYPSSIAAMATGADRLIGLLLVLAGGLLVVGWILPIMSVRTAFLLYDEVSILDGTVKLMEGEQYFLAAVIAVFSVVFPAAKILAALYIWFWADVDRPHIARLITWIEVLGKWSMLDVFVIALVVLMVQGSIFSEVALHDGLYAFAVAVILSLLLTQRLTTLVRRLGSRG